MSTFLGWRTRKRGTRKQIGKKFPVRTPSHKSRLPKKLKQVVVSPRRIHYFHMAQGVEDAEEVFKGIFANGRIIVRTYFWSHDGFLPKKDYEPIIYFFENSKNKPKHAITFSHYGKVYHKGLKSWNQGDYSPRFPNEFHTPVLLSDEVEIKNGHLSKGAYACAKASLFLRNQKYIENNSKIKSGLSPPFIKVTKEVKKILTNWRRCWYELET